MQEKPRKKRVLIIDDDRFILALARNNLKEYDVVTLCDRVGVIEALNDKRPDLVVIDYVLGVDLNGIDILKMIKQQDESIKCIMITGKSNESIINEAIEKGADFCYYKDVNLNNYIKDIINTIN